MYEVWFEDEMVVDNVKVFSGTYTECKNFIDGDDEYYIVAPDGVTVVD